MTDSKLLLQAEEYANRCDIPLPFKSRLGSGEEGCVWGTAFDTAIKAFDREKNFNLELKAYEILQFNNTSEIKPFNVPRLIGYDEDLLVIEISIVSPPYLLDFGKVYFQKPDYPSDAIREYEERIEDHFGKNIIHVRAALYELELMGIYYADANSRNICCDGIPESS